MKTKTHKERKKTTMNNKKWSKESREKFSRQKRREARLKAKQVLENVVAQTRGEAFHEGQTTGREQGIAAERAALSNRQQETQLELVKAFTKILDVFGQFAGTTSTIFGEWRR